MKPDSITMPTKVSFKFKKPEDMTNECWQDMINKLKNFSGVVITDAEFEIIEQKQLKAPE